MLFKAPRHTKTIATARNIRRNCCLLILEAKTDVTSLVTGISSFTDDDFEERTKLDESISFTFLAKSARVFAAFFFFSSLFWCSLTPAPGVWLVEKIAKISLVSALLKTVGDLWESRVRTCFYSEWIPEGHIVFSPPLISTFETSFTSALVHCRESLELLDTLKIIYSKCTSRGKFSIYNFVSPHGLL